MMEIGLKIKRLFRGTEVAALVTGVVGVGGLVGQKEAFFGGNLVFVI